MSEENIIDSADAINTLNDINAERTSNSGTDTNSTDSFGYLIVQVFAASGAYPVEGALVTISGEEGIIKVATTDKSGKTPLIKLPTPQKSKSQAPGEQASSSYNIDTDKDGYYGVRNIAISLFPYTTSIQRVELIPEAIDYIPRYGKTIIYNENRPQPK